MSRLRWILGGLALVAIAALPVSATLDRILPKSDISVTYREQYRRGLVNLKVASAAVVVVVLLYPALRRRAGPPRAHPDCRWTPSRLLRDPWLWAIVAVAAAVRIPGMGGSLQCDELYSYEAYVTRKIPFLLTFYNDTGNHLFYNFLAHLSCRAFGFNEAAQRLPALLLGLASIVATYMAARLLVPRRWALFAAALLALSSIHLRYSTEARAYSLMVLGAALGTYLLTLALHLRSPRYWLAYAATIVLSTWGHLFVGAVLAGHAVVVGMTKGPRGRVLRLEMAWTAALIGSVLAALYAVPLCFFGSAATATGVTKASWFNTLGFLGSAARDLGSPYAPVAGIVALWGLCAAGGVFVLMRRGRSRAALLLAPVGLSLLASLGPSNLALLRYHLYILPAFLIAVAASLAALSRAWRPAMTRILAGILLLACAGSVLAYHHRGRGDDRSASQAINDRAQKGDEVLITYATPCAFHAHYLRPDLGQTKIDADAALRHLPTRPRFVVVSRISYDPVPSPLTDLEQRLESGYERIATTGTVDDREFYAHAVWMRRQ